MPSTEACSDAEVNEGGEYYKTAQSVDEYIRMAEGYDGKEIIQKLKQFLPPESSQILELGSGPGKDWEILQSESFQHVVGSDSSPEFVKRLKLKHPKGTFWEMDASNLELPEAESTSKFDGVYSNKVLIHLTDEQLASSILGQYNLLREGGVVCHTFWKGDGTENHKGLFVNNQTVETLRKLFSDKFDTLVLEHYAEFGEGDSIIFIGKKKH